VGDDGPSTYPSSSTMSDEPSTIVPLRPGPYTSWLLSTLSTQQEALAIQSDQITFLDEQVGCP
jgi:hypothetical protein